MNIEDFPGQVQELHLQAKDLIYKYFNIIHVESFVDEVGNGTPRIIIKALFSGDIISINEQYDKYQEDWIRLSPDYYREMVYLQFDISTGEKR